MSSNETKTRSEKPVLHAVSFDDSAQEAITALLGDQYDIQFLDVENAKSSLPKYDESKKKPDLVLFSEAGNSTPNNNALTQASKGYLQCIKNSAIPILSICGNRGDSQIPRSLGDIPHLNIGTLLRTHLLQPTNSAEVNRDVEKGMAELRQAIEEAQKSATQEKGRAA